MSDTEVVSIITDFFLLDVTEISDEDSQFYPSFVVSFSWQDSRLKSDAGDQSATAIQKSSILGSAFDHKRPLN